MEPIKKQSNIGAGLAAIGVVLAGTIGVFASTFNPPATQPVATVIPIETPVTPPPNPAAFGSIFPAPSTTTPTPKPTPIPQKKVAMSVYTNGTYSATGSYNSPGGSDQIAVTVTLRNDIVTDVSVVPEAGDRTSARYQAMFVSGYKQYVVGKDISSVHVGRVSGSSLTGIGFNAAIARIESKAKA